MTGTLKMTGTRAIAYIRTSTLKQRLSPDAQRARITAFATSQGIEVVGWEADLGVSGATDLTKRPGLRAALVWLVLEQASVLLVASDDRLARGPLVSQRIRAAVSAAGAHVVAADADSPGHREFRLVVMTAVDAYIAAIQLNPEVYNEQ